jgi:tRNA threonylcarbamoyladenosine biosynthesis protein TsaB
MNLLAIDTSSVACSVALQHGGHIAERHEEQAREHTRLLVPMIKELLQESSVELTDLDAIVLGNGPGSFIGMRIAASVAQGLAFGSRLNIVPVSSLAAIAAQIFREHDADEVVVTQDAHMSEVYLGIFRRGEEDLPIEVIPERLHDQKPIAELETRGKIRVAAGFGWQRYPGLLEANKAFLDEVIELPHPRARHLLALGANGFARGVAVAPQDVLPAYLRQKVAEKPAAMS